MSKNDPIVIRDRRTEQRYFIDNAIIDNYGQELTVYGVAIYNVIVRHSNAYTQKDSFPSHATIADKLGCSARKVQDVINQSLIPLGLIHKERRERPDGKGQTSNEYWILDPPARDATPPSRRDTPTGVSEMPTINPPVDQSSDEDRAQTPFAPPEPGQFLNIDSLKPVNIGFDLSEFSPEVRALLEEQFEVVAKEAGFESVEKWRASYTTEEFIQWYNSQHPNDDITVVPPGQDKQREAAVEAQNQAVAHYAYLDEIAQEKGYRDYDEYYKKHAMGTFEDPPGEDQYSFTRHYKHESVTPMGRVREGPWKVRCEGCGGHVIVETAGVPAECRCGMHEYTITLKKPENTSRWEKSPRSVEMLYNAAAGRGVRRGDPAVEMYESVIESVVESDPDWQFWKEVLVAWMTTSGRGGKPYNPRNVGGILQCYEERRLPGQNKPDEEVLDARERERDIAGHGQIY